MGNICLIGVKGVGKTYLINKIRKNNENMVFFTGSEMIRKLAGNDFKEFDKLPTDKKEEYRDQVIEEFKLIQEDKGKFLLVDGHLTLYNKYNERIEEVVRQADIDFYQHYILLHPTPDLLYHRRVNDKVKPRITDVDIIEQEIKKEKEVAERLCQLHKKSLDIIELSSNEIIKKLEVLIDNYATD